MASVIGQHNCPVRERTGDGVPVGRCWHYCPDDVCPRHGDVSAALRLFRETGKLTDERELRAPSDAPRRGGHGG